MEGDESLNIELEYDAN